MATTKLLNIYSPQAMQLLLDHSTVEKECWLSLLLLTTHACDKMNI